MNEERATEDLLTQLRGLTATGEWAKSVALLTALHPADLAEVALDLEPASAAPSSGASPPT